MSKKHFEFVAKMIRELESQEERELLTTFFITLFSKFNPRFDIRRFCLACLPEEKEKELSPLSPEMQAKKEEWACRFKK